MSENTLLCCASEKRICEPRNASANPSQPLFEMFDSFQICSPPKISQVADDDTQLTSCSSLLRGPIVVTEKLDGGNCCLFAGRVFARTHSREAQQAWFSATKAFYLAFAHAVPNHLQLYGENMQAVHSIEYDAPVAPFYLFAVRNSDTGSWLPWPEVQGVAARYGIPLAPVYVFSKSKLGQILFYL